MFDPKSGHKDSEQFRFKLTTSIGCDYSGHTKT